MVKAYHSAALYTSANPEGNVVKLESSWAEKNILFKWGEGQGPEVPALPHHPPSQPAEGAGKAGQRPRLASHFSFP